MYTSVAPSRSNQEQVNQHRTECIRSYRYFLSLVSLPTLVLLVQVRYFCTMGTMGSIGTTLVVRKPRPCQSLNDPDHMLGSNSSQPQYNLNIETDLQLGSNTSQS